MKVKNFVKFLISIIVCQLAGGIGSIFTTSQIRTWYAGLIKPSFNPPNWIFGPVWTTLFFLMGFSLYIVWQKKISVNKFKAYFVFFAQLILNIAWSIIFFGLHSPLFAFFEIILLWVAILYTIFKFSKISKVASYLMIPYILWVSFASVLNFSIFILNR